MARIQKYQFVVNGALKALSQASKNPRHTWLDSIICGPVFSSAIDLAISQMESKNKIFPSEDTIKLDVMKPIVAASPSS